MTRSGLRFQKSSDGADATRPVFGFDIESLPPRTRERVVPCSARACGLAPFGIEQAGALEALERGEERSRIDLEHAAGDLLDATRDPEAVHGLEAQRLEDEHVERAGDDVGLRFGHWNLGGRPLTIVPLPLDCQ